MILAASTLAQREAMRAFMAEHGVALYRSDDQQLIGRVESGRLIAVVAYNDFYGSVCTMQIAGEGNWLSRELLKLAFYYPFIQMNLAAVIALVSEDNPRSLRFVKHVGFHEVHRIDDGYKAGVDLIVLKMRREDCKYIEVYNEAISKAA